MTSRKIPINIIFVICVFVVSAFYTINAFSLSFGSFKSPGPGFIPRITGILAMLFSIAILIIDARKMAAGEGEDNSEDSFAFPLRPILFVVSFILYVLIFETLGYVVSTVIFAFILSMIMRNKWWVSAIISISTGVAFFAIFSLLAVPLPLGILG